MQPKEVAVPTGAEHRFRLLLPWEIEVALWLEDFMGMGLAEGQAWPLLPVTGAEVSLGEAFVRPRGRAMFCMRRASACGSSSSRASTRRGAART